MFSECREVLWALYVTHIYQVLQNDSAARYICSRIISGSVFSLFVLGSENAVSSRTSEDYQANLVVGFLLM